MMWRTHSCVPVEDSARRLVLNWDHTRTCVETSLDTARCAGHDQQLGSESLLLNRMEVKG